MSPIRVLLADDHLLVRAGIRSLLQNVPEIQVVAEAGNGSEAVRLVDQCLEGMRPQVVVMDITMPVMTGLEAAGRIIKQFPDVRVILLSMHTNEEFVRRALQVGVTGYLVKDAGTHELEFAIKAVARGESYLSPIMSKHIADYLRRVGEPILEDRLTARQREVLQLIAEGYSTQEIANELIINVKTAERHRAEVMERLDIHDIAGLVRYAIRHGLILASCPPVDHREKHRGCTSSA